MFTTAAVAILLLSNNLPTGTLYCLVAIAGACTIGTTVLVDSYTATHFPEHLRATALGFALGVGRLGAIFGPIYGGWILDTDSGTKANFYAFAIPAAIGALAMIAIPAPRRSAVEPQPAGSRAQAQSWPSRDSSAWSTVPS